MELSPDGHKHNCITSVTKPSFLTPSLTFLCQQMENYLMSGYVVRHNCGKFHHSVKDNRNENIVLFFFFQTCWHYINVLLTAAGFISVIFVCNASGTPEICSHTCSQSTQSSQRDPPRLGGRCVRHIQICAFHIPTHTVTLHSCW